MRCRPSQIAALLLLALTGFLPAHSLHQSTAEAEYNAATKKLEISLTVFINDLELALIRRAEKLISLEKTPQAELDATITAYLSETFVVRDAAGKAAKIEWAGREMDDAEVKSDDPAVTLFFEIPLPQGLAGHALEHSVFCELFADQVNLLHLRAADKKTQLSFKPGATIHQISLGGGE